MKFITAMQFMLDTHLIFKRLVEAGFTEKQAEVMTDVSARLRNEIVDREYFEMRMHEYYYKTIIALGGMMTAIGGIIIAVLYR